MDFAFRSTSCCTTEVLCGLPFLTFFFLIDSMTVQGTLTAIRDWFRDYNIPDGKPTNRFGLGNKPTNKVKPEPGPSPRFGGPSAKDKTGAC
jgi:hypothetical protein